MSLSITNVETFLVQPGGSRLVIVKVQTSEDGLYGLGCGTYTQRHRAVEAALNHHLGPFVMGKDPRNTEDLWQGMMVNGYWRNGPVINNAVSGIDMALWDIKGKLAGMPCYDLFGGRCRPAAAVYTHAGGNSLEQAAENVAAAQADGYHHIRCQLGGYPGIAGADARRPEGALPGAYFDPRVKLHEIPKLFAYLREQLGDEVELLHDIHERLAPIDAVWLARALEPYRLFFLEDLLAPEDNDWFRQIRATSTTPLAMGELYNNPREILPMIAERLIDFIRVHVSQIGGVTPALKLARVCESFGVRTAWHGPGDTSPVGMMANIHIDVAVPNFGIQEWAKRNANEYDLFPGLAEVRQGYVYPNDQPGWGIDFDVELAKKFPVSDDNPTWTVCRLPDGTQARP